MTFLAAEGCLTRNEWICGEYLETRQDLILSATAQHVTLTLVSMAFGVLLSLPLGILAFRYRGARPLVLGTTTILYTIPSLAMFMLLLPFFYVSATTVVIGLVLYSLTLLVRNVVAGLDAVPADVVESARGMGHDDRSLLLKVQLPLALPTMFAGLRVATVSTISLLTVGALINHGGLGNLILSGLATRFNAQVLAASVIVVLLAVVADVALLGLQRLVTPWQRGVR